MIMLFLEKCKVHKARTRDAFKKLLSKKDILHDRAGYWLVTAQEGLCYREDRNFFHSSDSLQLGGRPPPAFQLNSRFEESKLLEY